MKTLKEWCCYSRRSTEFYIPRFCLCGPRNSPRESGLSLVDFSTGCYRPKGLVYLSLYTSSFRPIGVLHALHFKVHLFPNSTSLLTKYRLESIFSAKSVG